VLQLIGISVAASSSFSRKFELVSGWSILRTVLQESWDADVHEAAFDLLLGHKSKTDDAELEQIVCPHVVPAILASLSSGLKGLANGGSTYDEDGPQTVVEKLIERLIELHSQNHMFRQVFRSQQTTQLFIDGYKGFVTTMSSTRVNLSQELIRILEKVMHLAMSLALDNDVAGSQKREASTLF
jgi:hypothetical protein